jgi:predicted DNA-binding transcriptional regulator AlpA
VISSAGNLGNRVVYKRADVEAWIESRYNAEAARSA